MRRLLVKYAKEGGAALLSHRDSLRALERALRRSDLPLVYSEGFSPRLRMSLSPALPLGVCAEAEYLEVSVEEEVAPEDARDRINRGLPQGLQVSEIQPLAPTMPKLSRWVRYGLYRIDAGESTIYILLQLSGEGQGRLKDALTAVSERVGRPVDNRDVTRVGLYASPDEVLEDVREPVYFYDGRKGGLEEMAGD